LRPSFEDLDACVSKVLTAVNDPYYASERVFRPEELTTLGLRERSGAD